jgi:nucleoside-diphosphate-sugar epimerase
MKILVCGGRGFIGSRLVSALVKKGIEVDVLSRNLDYSEHKNNTFNMVKGDLLNCDCETLVSGYSVIYNCAGELHDESLMYSLHVEAIARMISACKKVAKLENRRIHWVQLSSVGAYGPYFLKSSAERFITEDSATAPRGMYETTKTLADEIVCTAADEFLSYTILRPSNVFGPNMPNNSIRQLARMIRKGLFFYIGRRGAVSNYVHVDDVVDALILCGFDVRANGEIFNLSNDCDQDIVIKSIARALHVPEPTLQLNESLVRAMSALFFYVKRFPLSKTRIDALVNRTHYPSNKLLSKLNFKPFNDFEKTISEVLLNDKEKN